MNRHIENVLYAPMGWMLHGLALLPLRALYALSTGIYALLYHIVRYRRKTVADNLARCFPHLGSDERSAIERRFYRNLSDYFFETIKLLHVSDEEMRRRIVFENMEVLDTLFDSGKSVVAYFSHCFNWEWAPAITLWSRYKGCKNVRFCQVYRPLKNEWADRFMLRLRSRFGSESLPKRTVLRDLLRMRSEGIMSVTGFMSDQKPSHGDPTLPLMLLNRPTAMITGTETLARKLKTAVIYFDLSHTSRGHYRLTLKHISDDASETAPMEITRHYADMLQESIERDPADWLWTHRRWKNPVKLPANDEPQAE